MLRLIRFGLVGGLASLIYAVVTYALISKSIAPVWGSVIAYAIAIPVSFLGQKYFTFDAQGRVPVELSLFVITQAIGLILAAVIMSICTNLWPTKPLIGIGFVVTAIPIMSYFSMRYLVFPKLKPNS